MSDLRQLTELMEAYSSAIKEVTVSMEAFSHGEVKTMLENLREVYEGHGADSFFARWDESEHQVSEHIEDILRLQLRLEQWVNTLTAFDQPSDVS